MKYEHIVEGRFIERPNRFVAYVDIDGKREKVHVKNTGRCRELLQDNAQVFLSYSDNASRSTAYDLVAVKKGDRMVNMDSQAPNIAVKEWLEVGKEHTVFGKITYVKPEKTYENSRFDFYVEDGEERAFLEVKGVTLEDNGIVRFPDAPTERGIKHLHSLIACLQDGYDAYVLFIVQMREVREMRPNDVTHKAFGDALRQANTAGVKVIAIDCHVSPDEVIPGDFVPVVLD